jgi:Rod binding domain-containing protein
MALPPIDRSLLPADVRDASPAKRRTYEAALGFERMLVAQLAKSLSDTTGGDESAETSAATSTYRNMLPDALADGIIAGGGLGLAKDIYKGLR